MNGSLIHFGLSRTPEIVKPGPISTKGGAWLSSSKIRLQPSEARVPGRVVNPWGPQPRRSRLSAQLRHPAQWSALRGVGRLVALVRVLPQPDEPCPFPFFVC